MDPEYGEPQQASTAQLYIFMAFFLIVLAVAVWLNIYNRKYQMQRNQEIGNVVDRGLDDFEKYLANKSAPAAPAASS